MDGQNPPKASFYANNQQFFPDVPVDRTSKKTNAVGTNQETHHDYENVNLHEQLDSPIYAQITSVDERRISMEMCLGSYEKIWKITKRKDLAGTIADRVLGLRKDFIFDICKNEAKFNSTIQQIIEDMDPSKPRELDKFKYEIKKKV
uniref:Mediator complex subunit 15 n=1 Tax=Rhabditophanes sp. KR3021 TaxID=114890 RepID=A0AC35TW56_9BILA